MPTDDELRESIAQDILAGDEEKQLADRRVKKMDPVKRLEALRLLQADEVAAVRGPFVRIGFRRRPF